MSDETNCLHCGAKLIGRWESLSAGLAKTLIKFYEIATEKGVNAVHLQDECDFSINENNNFQKLRYFGLVVPFEKHSGYWMLTKTGAEFVRNRMKKPKKVYVFRNRVKEVSEKRIFITEALKSEPFWLKHDDFLSEESQFDAQRTLFE